MLVRKYSTGVAITNPLVLYRALLATNHIRPDPAQHRLALHLQKLYERLKDYEPTAEYSHRLHQISRAVGTNGRAKTSQEETQDVRPRGFWSSLLVQKEKRESTALARVLTSHEQAMQLDSPRGLMLHGEVGTGKSMLIDLFADCLPNRKKRRWHFNTFMLDTLAKLEALRRTRSSTFFGSSVFDDEHSLLILARDMIETSPILFLDEFQLPDRAASKIMSNLMTSFFHLGGVLIATSNRMPEELAKAAGMEFTPPPTRMDSLKWRFGVRGRNQNMFTGRGDFAPFLEVLKARCEVWEMEGGKDYRRSESEAAVPKTETDSEASAQKSTTAESTPTAQLSPGSQAEDSVPKMASMPKNYFVKPSTDEPTSKHEEWLLKLKDAESVASGVTSPEIPWSPSTMRVYGRQVQVPRQYNGATSWTFSELCASQLGPADYITLASTYHTLILTDVPVLSLLQKNEARRFITLLDALYEARCKLLITAAAGPDDVFFPESKAKKPSSSSSVGDSPSNQQQDSDSVYSETFSDIYQDATAPFRPNISSYDPSSPQPREEPDYTHARLQGMLSPDALEDDPPNRVRRGTFTGSFGLDRDYGGGGAAAARAGGSSSPGANGWRVAPTPDFGQAGAFTGEDERFAYKRARSRLWEMCGARWWARDCPQRSWWTPVAKEVRRWEVPVAERAALERQQTAGLGGEGMGATSEIDEKKDEPLFRHGGTSPFRTFPGPPPKIGWTHVWGTVQWGKKAGAWGKGVDGLEERRREREREEEGEGEKETEGQK
ncbi:Lactation elevated protein 1-like protein B [Lasiodiplodia hormozganensis]|uniref:Lactation elevated protein 1-like protein B n=1 Tax=Lasiodiplodia hormozganensis TaxID=869390 RepID=A0AA40CX06_9PEZI|nr:Lactation elevated protein 1-like protein B [Lasiodiplodia hormozganensis]